MFICHIAWLALFSASPYHASGPLRGSLVRDEAVAVYSEDRGDPWNRIQHLLFASWVTSTVRGNDPSRWPPRPDDRMVPVRRLEGGDLPDFFFTIPDLGFLLRSPRHGRLVAALEAELAAPHLVGRTAEARLLFQGDLWSRFDGLSVPGGREGPRRSLRRARLRDLLGRVIAKVALSREELSRVSPNLEEAARSFPEVEAGVFSAESTWREIVFGVSFTTSHAQTAGHRRVFRAFLRAPEESGGVGCLEARFGGAASTADCGGLLPFGTRALLLETTLALTDRGEIVHVPLLLAVQSRTFQAAPLSDGAGPEPGDLPFVVLCASRQRLSQGDRRDGGLERLAPDEPIPQVVGCVPRAAGGLLLPSAVSCTGCHGIEGRHVMTGARLESGTLELLFPGSERAAERVIRAKEAREDYRALRRFFPPECRAVPLSRAAPAPLPRMP